MSLINKLFRRKAEKEKTMEMSDKIKEKVTAEDTENKDGKETVKTEETVENKETVKPEPSKDGGDENKGGDGNGENGTPSTQVDNTPSAGNGIPLDMVALKTDVESMIKEAIAPFQSKLDSVLKENEDLKEQLAQSKSETENIRKKYEDNGDFGTSQKKGAGFTDGKSGSSTYVSYEEMWNGAKSFEKS